MTKVDPPGRKTVENSYAKVDPLVNIMGIVVQKGNRTTDGTIEKRCDMVVFEG